MDDPPLDPALATHLRAGVTAAFVEAFDLPPEAFIVADRRGEAVLDAYVSLPPDQRPRNFSFGLDDTLTSWHERWDQAHPRPRTETQVHDDLVARLRQALVERFPEGLERFPGQQDVRAVLAMALEEAWGPAAALVPFRMEAQWEVFQYLNRLQKRPVGEIGDLERYPVPITQEGSVPRATARRAAAIVGRALCQHFPVGRAWPLPPDRDPNRWDFPPWVQALTTVSPVPPPPEFFTKTHPPLLALAVRWEHRHLLATAPEVLRAWWQIQEDHAWQQLVSSYDTSVWVAALLTQAGLPTEADHRKRFWSSLDRFRAALDRQFPTAVAVPPTDLMAEFLGHPRWAPQTPFPPPAPKSAPPPLPLPEDYAEDFPTFRRTWLSHHLDWAIGRHQPGMITRPAPPFPWDTLDHGQRQHLLVGTPRAIDLPLAGTGPTWAILQGSKLIGTLTLEISDWPGTAEALGIIGESVVESVHMALTAAAPDEPAWSLRPQPPQAGLGWALLGSRCLIGHHRLITWAISSPVWAAWMEADHRAHSPLQKVYLDNLRDAYGGY